MSQPSGAKCPTPRAIVGRNEWLRVDRRVYVEPAPMRQIRPSGKPDDAAKSDDAAPPPIVLNPKTPVEPPVRVLSIVNVDALDLKLLNSMLELPDGPVAIEAPPDVRRSRLTSQSSNTIQTLHAWEGSQFGKHPCSIGRV
jgi:hypothetical protein